MKSRRARGDAKAGAGGLLSGIVALVASFAPERSEGANDATRGTNKLYARQRSCDYHYYKYTRPNRTNVFHKEKLFDKKSCCGFQIPFTDCTSPFGPRKGAF